MVLFDKQLTFCNYGCCASHIDGAVFTDLCGHHRRPTHGLTLKESTFRLDAKTSALLQIIGQRCIGGTRSGFLGDVIQWGEIAHMSGITVVSERKTWKLTASYLLVSAVMAFMSGFKFCKVATSGRGSMMSHNPE